MYLFVDVMHRWKLGATSLVMAVVLTSGCAASQPDRPREPVDVRRALSSPSGRAYVVVDTRRKLANRILAVDFIPSGAPRVTPIHLSDVNGLPSLPMAIAATPDGARLFVVSVMDEGDVPDPRYRLSIVDPANPIPEEGGGEVPDFFDEIGGPTFPPLVVSADSEFVYVLGGDGRITTYDVRTSAVLPQTAPLPGCGPASLMTLAEPRRIAVLCIASQEVHLLQIGPSGELENKISHGFRIVPDGTDSFGNPLGNAHWAVITPDLARIWVFTGNGNVFEVDATSGAIAAVGDLGVSPEDYIPYSTATLSADGGVLAVGLRSLSLSEQGEAGHGARIMVVDTASWKASATVETAGHLRWLTMDASGNIYALFRDAGHLMVVDGDALVSESMTLPLGGDPLQLIAP